LAGGIGLKKEKKEKKITYPTKNKVVYAGVCANKEQLYFKSAL